MDEYRGWQVGETIVDLYEITAILGEGGMGRVYKARHKGWNIDLAIKSPKPDIFTQAGGKENFVREAETWINLGVHPHIVSCYYVRTIDEIPRVFAEYIEGGSLADWIRGHQLYEGEHERVLERMLDVAIQFARGLDYAHEQGLVHQDVKPANVMMTPDGIAKVTDFGLAKARTIAGEISTAHDGQSILVSSGGRTPAYCSPEQGAGKPLNRKTDIWSWGLSVLEMFVGEVTWMAGQAAEAALTGYLETGTQVPVIPPMPKALAELLQQCFHKDLHARPANMSVIADELQNIYQHIIGNPYARPAPKAADVLADSLNNRAVSMLDLGKAEEAERLWNEALRVDPRHREATFNRGVAQWRRGDIRDDELLQQMEARQNLHTHDWIDSYLLGLIHLEQTDIARAVSHLEEATKLSADAMEVQATLQLAQASGSDHDPHTFKWHTENVNLNIDERWAILGTSGHIYMSTNGRWLAWGGKDGRVSIRDLATDAVIQTTEGHAEPVNAVCISENGGWVISGSGSHIRSRFTGRRENVDNTLRLWDTETGRCLQIFHGHTEAVTAVCFVGEQDLIVSASDDRTLRLWSIETGKCLHIFSRHTNFVTCLSLSADGRLALSGSTKTRRAFEDMIPNDLLCIWDVETGRYLRSLNLPNEEQEILSVCLSADGHFGLSASSHALRFSNTLRLWEISTGRCLRSFHFEGQNQTVNWAGLSTDGRCVISAHDDGTRQLWHLPETIINACSPQISRPRSHSDLITTETRWQMLLKNMEDALVRNRFDAAFEIAQELRQIPDYNRAPQTMEMLSKLSLYCRRIGIHGAWLLKAFKGHTDQVNSVCLSADGRWALSGSADKTMRFWQTATGECVQTFVGHHYPVTAVCLSRDATLALSGSSEKMLRLWDVATGRCLQVFEGHSETISSIDLHPDGLFAISASHDKTLRLWDMNGKCLRTLKGHRGGIWSVSLSADGRVALSGSEDSTLRLWDIMTGKCLRIFKGHTDAVTSTSLSIGGHLALSVSSDKTLRLWDVMSGNCLRVFENPHVDKEIKGIYLNSIIYTSCNNCFVFSGNADHSVCVWNTDIVPNADLMKLVGHTGWITSIDASADGHFLLSGSDDNTLRLWELDWEVELLGPADWDNGALPYLDVFLKHHTSRYRGIFMRANPTWDDKDFRGLIQQLQYGGYGWLKPGGIEDKLLQMAKSRR